MKKYLYEVTRTELADDFHDNWGVRSIKQNPALVKFPDGRHYQVKSSRLSPMEVLEWYDGEFGEDARKALDFAIEKFGYSSLPFWIVMGGEPCQDPAKLSSALFTVSIECDGVLQVFEGLYFGEYVLGIGLSVNDKIERLQ